MKELTQERLKELVHYDPDTGEFTNLVTRSNRSMAGNKLGSINASGYYECRIQGFRCYLHRLAFLYIDGEIPANEVDHINQNPSDNRWSNLRCVTPTENRKNQKLRSDNNAGIVGVCWHKAASKWHAQITSEGKNYNLGLYENLNDAASARVDAEDRLCFHANHGRLA